MSTWRENKVYKQKTLPLLQPEPQLSQEKEVNKNESEAQSDKVS